MRKGFTLTLMTVAIAMLGTQAQAMAPVIADIPSPIVGSAESVTGGGTYGNYVYLDAIDLNMMATDDNVTNPSNLLWTYTGAGSNGASNYLINGVNPLTGSLDPTSPTTAQIINRNDLDPVPGKDAFKNTITIRNKTLSPLPMGSTGTTPAGANGLVANQTELVTFFCSDGNAFSSETVFFYTDKGGNDRLSGGDPFKIEKTDKATASWTQNPNEWTGGITRVAGAGGNGVCLNVNLNGENAGSVITAMPYFNLASNQVYRFKMKMSSSNATAMNVPFWDMTLENYAVGSTNPGLNLYIMDTLVFPNQGGANAVPSTGTTFTWYWTPPAVATDQWKNGAFTTARDANNDPRLRFRVMDYDSVTALQATTKSGQVCINELEIAAADITRAKVKATHVNITSLVQANAAGTGNVEVVALNTGLTTAFASGAVTLTPTGASQDVEMPDIRPQARTGGFTADPASADAAASFPIAWKSGKILRMQVGMSAPTATDEANPWDAYCFLFNTMTNELNMESWQTSNQGIGSPKVGTPQTYTTFFHTGNETTASNTGYHRLRWYIRAANVQTANFPSGTATHAKNTGAVRIHSIKVDEVEF